MDKLIIIRTDNQNNLYEQIISLITANQAKMETMSFGVFPTLFFPGLEIRQHQRRVFRDGEEINLTRLEYSTLVFLASNPGNVLTQEQIFEAVWNMDSDSCHSSVVNVIYNLRKKFFAPVFVKYCYENTKRFSGGLCHIFLPVRSNNDGKNIAAKLAEAPPSPSRVSAEAYTAESVTFLEQDSTTVPNFAYRLILSCGNLVGVATPSPPFCGLRRLKNLPKKFFRIFQKTLPLLPLFFSY